MFGSLLNFGSTPEKTDKNSVRRVPHKISGTNDLNVYQPYNNISGTNLDADIFFRERRKTN